MGPKCWLAATGLCVSSQYYMSRYSGVYSTVICLIILITPMLTDLALPW